MKFLDWILGRSKDALPQDNRLEIAAHHKAVERDSFPDRWLPFKLTSDRRVWDSPPSAVMISPLAARPNWLCAIGGEYIYDSDGNPLIDRCIPVILSNYRMVDV